MPLVIRQRIVVQQRDVTVLRNPVDPDVDGLAGLHRHVEVLIPGGPVLPPAIEHQLAVDVHLEIAAAVELELVVAGLRRFDAAFPGHGLVRQDVGRRPGGRLFPDEQFLRPVEAVADVLVVDVLLDALELELAVDGVTRGEAAFLAGRVADLEISRYEAIRLRIAEARDRVVVPQHAVVAARHHERHADIHVVLRDLDVLTVEVHLRVLMLAHAEEGFVAARVEALRHALVRARASASPASSALPFGSVKCTAPFASDTCATSCEVASARSSPLRSTLNGTGGALDAVTTRLAGSWRLSSATAVTRTMRSERTSSRTRFAAPAAGVTITPVAFCSNEPSGSSARKRRAMPRTAVLPESSWTPLDLDWIFGREEM